MQSLPVEKDAIALARSAPQEPQSRTHLPLLTGGIRTDKSPNDLAPNEVVNELNLRLLAGRLRVDTGYTSFSHEFLGVAQKPFQVLFNDSSSVTLLVTSETVYTYEPGVAQWQLASLNSMRVTTSPTAAGFGVFDLDDVSDIVLGTRVGIIMDNGEQLITFVNGISVLQITTFDMVPIGRSVASGAEVAVAIGLSGDPTVSQVSIAVFPGNDWIIFSNGINPIYYYYQHVVTLLPGLPTDTTCATIAVFHELLLLGNTTENGTHLPHRVRQSDAGDPTGWDPGVDGIAAIYDLLDTDDWIFSLKTLGPWLIGYRESSVMRASYIGALNQILFWEYMSQQDGIQSQGAVADVGTSHILVGTNGIYEYKGGYDLPNIGQGVFENFLDVGGDLYAGAKLTIFTVYMPVLREVWVFYPSTMVDPSPNTPTFPNKTLRYDIDHKSWAIRVFNDLFIGSGAYTPQSFTTWAQAPGAWNDLIWARAWQSRVSVQNVPNLLLCSSLYQQLYVYDYTTTSDVGVTIPWEIVTRQYGDGTVFTRWERLVLVGIGQVLVEFSEDTSETWTVLRTVDFSPFSPPQVEPPRTETVQTVWIDRASTRIQFRLSGVDSRFQLRYGDLYSESESEW